MVTVDDVATGPKCTHNDQQTAVRRENERIVDGQARNEPVRVFKILDHVDSHFFRFFFFFIEPNSRHSKRAAVL